ncbi:MAG: hypothetical protein ACI8QZ_001965 [Chlamydiales bacterium]|jgi:hypothetical protein
MSFTSRMLVQAGPPDGPAAAADELQGSEPGWATNLRWFSTFLFMHMGARSALTIPGSDEPFGQALYGLAIVTAALGCAPGFARGAARLATLMVLGQLLLSMPDTANHVFLEFVLFLLLAMLDPGKEPEAKLLMRGLRWYIAIFFVYAGIQKVIYGYYFDGQFLAYMAATEDRFTLVFQHLIPAPELERLQAFNEAVLADGRHQPATDAGPYRVDAPLFVVMSNLVWMYEIVAPILLMFRRTRAAAALSIIAFVLLIELGAREITFGMLMTNLALLYLWGPWIKRLFPAFALAYLYLLLADGGGAGIFPMFWYSPA